MTTAEMKRIVEASPRFKSRITAVFYLVTILAGTIAILVQGRLGIEVIVAACYIAVIALFYQLSTEQRRR
jgi:hypothetical protein